jgi:hypothetical protein
MFTDSGHLRTTLVVAPYEHLLPEQRVLLLRVAAAAVQNVAVRPMQQEAATALRICITQWEGGEVYRT